MLTSKLENVSDMSSEVTMLWSVVSKLMFESVIMLKKKTNKPNLVSLLKQIKK